MRDQVAALRRNLFEIDNARNLSREELVETFVPTQAFWRLLSAKHHIVLGARGSGKTALAKMMSHDHLSRLKIPRAQTAIGSYEYIGLYVPTRLEWVGGLRNKPWQSEQDEEEFFQWRLNFAAALALIDTASSCIECYVSPDQRARRELTVSAELCKRWLGEGYQSRSLPELRKLLYALEDEKQSDITKRRIRGGGWSPLSPIGEVFHSDLFVPLRSGIRLMEEAFSLGNKVSWLLCLDEAEFLQRLHHQALNSHMRAYPDRLFLKMTTMPYCHYTLDTNVGPPLDPGHDFEYVYIDADPVFRERTSREQSSEGTQFAKKLFKLRARASGLEFVPHGPQKRHTRIVMEERRELSLYELLGPSRLLDDDQTSNWGKGSELCTLLEKYGSEETLSRANELVGTPAFLNSIGRKLAGALRLREAWDGWKGNAEVEVFSGATMAVRCGDANPRRLIRIFNSMLLSIGKRAKRGPTEQISFKDQTRVLRSFSESTLLRTRTEPQVGPQLYEFLCLLGEFMHWWLIERPLGTDLVGGVSLDDSMTDNEWEVIKRAVGLGLLYPPAEGEGAGELPIRGGTFFLSHVLAPHFFVLPRGGKTRSLRTIKRWKTGARALDDDSQEQLFKELP